MKKKLKIYGKKLENTLERCNKEMLVLKRQCEKLLVLEEMDSFLFALFRAAAAMDELLQKEGNISLKSNESKTYEVELTFNSNKGES